jgi:Arc/MetJ family transcription regulator
MRRITVVLPKDVATAAKMMAVQRDVPLRAVVELALRRLLGMPAEKEGGEK